MPPPRRDKIYQRLLKHISRHDPGRGGEAYDFNIRLREIYIPDSVRSAVTQGDIDYRVADESEGRLRSFAERLELEFPWIESWGQTGRSGGWLTIVTNDAVIDEAPEWPSPESLKAARGRLADLDRIRDMVNEEVSAFERDLESEAFWGVEPEEWRPRE